MNKREVVWLIIRLAGAYLLYLAIMASINFAGTFMSTLQMLSLLEKSFWILAQAFFMLAVQAVVGIYLLMDGRILFDILSKEGPGRDPL